MESPIVFIAIVVGIIQLLLVWAIFNMRSNIAKQTAINIAMVRLLAKISNNTGSNPLDTKEVLDSLNRNLND